MVEFFSFMVEFLLGVSWLRGGLAERVMKWNENIFACCRSIALVSCVAQGCGWHWQIDNRWTPELILPTAASWETMTSGVYFADTGKSRDNEIWSLFCRHWQVKKQWNPEFIIFELPSRGRINSGFHCFGSWSLNRCCNTMKSGVYCCATPEFIFNLATGSVEFLLWVGCLSRVTVGSRRPRSPPWPGVSGLVFPLSLVWC